MNTATPRLLTAEEAAEYLNIDTRTLRGYRESGKVPAIKLSHRVVRYDVRDLDDYIEVSRQVGTG